MAQVTQHVSDPWRYIKRRSVIVPSLLAVDELPPSPLLTAFPTLLETPKKDLPNQFREVFVEKRMTYSSRYWGGMVIMSYNDDDFLMWKVDEGYFFLLEGTVRDGVTHIIRYGYCNPCRDTTYTTKFADTINSTRREVINELLQGLIELRVIADNDKTHEYPVALLEPMQTWGDFDDMSRLTFFLDSLWDGKENVLEDMVRHSSMGHMHFL